MSGYTNRIIKLYCPSLSKPIHYGSCNLEQKLDLGSIARAFGLDPRTLKLNGYFISRGLDLVASSVTWNSLFSFFAARGLSTGLSGAGPLVVDGKLFRVGEKRMHAPENTDIEAMNTKGYGFDCLDSNLLSGDSEAFNAKRVKHNKSAEDNQTNSSLKRWSLSEDQNSLKRRTCVCSPAGDDRQIYLSPKRRPLSEDQNSLKRTRTNGTSAGSSQWSRSFISQNMKREREDEMLLAGPSKRLR